MRILRGGIDLLQSAAINADIPVVRRTHRAGLYAEDRFRRGRRRWRRRAGRRLLWLVSVALVFLAIAAALRTPVWWFAAGLACGGSCTFGLWVWEQPPWDVAKWGIGAQGERWTEDALRGLEDEGWTVEHDLEREYGNDDHLVVSPNGVYLLETKALRGRVTVENGVLSSVSLDDPENVNNWDRLAAGLRGRAATVSRKAAADSGETQWVQGVVVIWGDFVQRAVVDDHIVYVHGSALVEWLRAQRPARVELMLR